MDLLDTSILEEVDSLLEQTKISTPATLQLLTRLVSRVYVSQNEVIKHVRIQNGRVTQLEKDVELLKKKSIINWVENNFKASIAIFISFVLFIDILVESLSSSVAISFIWDVLKKQLGI